MKYIYLELNNQKERHSNCSQEKKLLQEQLELQTKRHQVELETMKTTLIKLKDEHVFSLKNNLEGTCKEKVSLQVRLKAMEDTLCEKEEKMNKLIIENKKLLEELKKKNEESSLI